MYESNIAGEVCSDVIRDGAYEYVAFAVVIMYRDQSGVERQYQYWKF